MTIPCFCNDEKLGQADITRRWDQTDLPEGILVPMRLYDQRPRKVRIGHREQSGRLPVSLANLEIDKPGRTEAQYNQKPEYTGSQYTIEHGIYNRGWRNAHDVRSIKTI